jgi:uncharacterized membrane-anchored protein YhcB (DUF1043 family)
VSALAAMALALAIGLFLGFVLKASYTATTGSHLQERLQREIRNRQVETEQLKREVLNWQAETVRAREAADNLARELEALERPKQPAGAERR